MTDHPPAIPAITVTRFTRRALLEGEAPTVYGAFTIHGKMEYVTVPLGLSPEQPCRVGGHDE